MNTAPMPSPADAPLPQTSPLQLPPPNPNITPAAKPPELPSNIYANAGTHRFTPEARAILTAPVPAEEVEIRPDGLLFAPEMQFRLRLNAAFGPGGWGLVPLTNAILHENQMMQKWAIFVDGKFAAQATGQQDYHTNNRGMSYGDAMEACKSNALTRCCKDLTIFHELWTRGWIIKWLEVFAIQIWAMDRKNTAVQIWVRKDRPIPPPYKVHPSAPFYPQPINLTPHSAPQAPPGQPIHQQPAQPPYQAPQHVQQPLALENNHVEQIGSFFTDNIATAAPVYAETPRPFVPPPPTSPPAGHKYRPPASNEEAWARNQTFNAPKPPPPPSTDPFQEYPNPEHHGAPPPAGHAIPSSPNPPVTAISIPQPPTPGTAPTTPTPTAPFPNSQKNPGLLKDTKTYGKVQLIQRRDSPGKDTVYGVKVDSQWHTTKDLALYDRARELKAKDCLVCILFENRPYSAGIYRFILSIEIVIDPTLETPSAMPDPPPDDTNQEPHA